MGKLLVGTKWVQKREGGWSIKVGFLRIIGEFFDGVCSSFSVAVKEHLCC